MKSCLIFLSLIIASAQGQQLKQAGFHIEGHVKGVSEKSSVCITDANKPTDTLAKGVVNGGVFILKGHVKEPSLLILNFSSVQKKSSVFLGNETITVSGDIENLGSLQVKGSTSQDDFVVFEQTFNNYFTQLNQLSQLSNAPDAASKRDSIGQAYQQVAMEIQTRVDNFIQQKNII